MPETKIKIARTNHKFTQREVAERVGISVLTYQRYEKGERIPNAVTAIKLARVLGVEMKELFQ